MKKHIFILLVSVICFVKTTYAQKSVFALGVNSTIPSVSSSFIDYDSNPKIINHFQKIVNGKTMQFYEYQLGKSRHITTTRTQSNLGASVAYYRYSRPKKISVRTGLNISYFSIGKTEEESIEFIPKTTHIDSSYEGGIFDCGNNGSNYKGNKFSAKVINFSVPIDVFFNIKKWSFGIGASSQLPIFYQQNLVYLIDKNEIQPSCPPDEREKGNFSAAVQVSIVRWAKKSGFELSINKQLRALTGNDEYYQINTQQILPFQFNFKYLIKL